MPIKITYEKIAQLRDPLPGRSGPISRLADADLNTSFANRIQISRFLKPVTEAIREYEKSFLELLQKYGKSQGSGNFEISADNLGPYQDELKELLSIEIELGTLPLPQKVLESTALTPRDLSLLEDSGLILLGVG